MVPVLYPLGSDRFHQLNGPVGSFLSIGRPREDRAGPGSESRLPRAHGTAPTASRTTIAAASVGARALPITRAAIFGASGGIGAALVAATTQREPDCRIYAGTRRLGTPDDRRIVRFAFVATGMLVREDGAGPEKSLRGVTAHGLAEQFAVNTIGPALVA